MILIKEIQLKSSNTTTLEKILSYFGFVPKEYYDYELSRNKRCVAEIDKLRSELDDAKESYTELKFAVAHQKSEQDAMVDAYENQVKEAEDRIVEFANLITDSKAEINRLRAECLEYRAQIANIKDQHVLEDASIMRDGIDIAENYAKQLEVCKKQLATAKGLATRYRNKYETLVEEIKSQTHSQ